MTQVSIYKKIEFIESITNSLLSKDEKNISIWCPFCKHSNKNKLKLVIQLEKELFHCWLCNKKGSNIPYVISQFNINKKNEAKSLFRDKKKKSFDLNLSLIEDNEEFIENEVRVSLPSDFKLLVTAYNETNPNIRDIFKYAIKRGFNKHKMWMLKVGYSQNNEFNRSLIMPSLDKEGNINFYTSRKIDVDSNSPIKYKNANISKKNIIFNEINIDWSIPLTLVEGPLDLIKTNDNATCLLGSSLTEDMLLFREIIKNKTDINLALDSDVYHKSLKIANLLNEYDINVSILDTRLANDVGDMSHNQFKDCLNNAKKYKKDDFLLRKIAML